jgi:hypothetical protein
MVSTIQEIRPQFLDFRTAQCPTGTNVLGGGVKSFDYVDENGNDVSETGLFGEDQPIEIKKSYPVGTSGWRGVAFNHDFFTGYHIRVYAICADVTP